MRQTIARLDVVETTHKRGVNLDDVINDEVVAPNPNPKPKEDQDEARLLRVLSWANSVVKSVVLFLMIKNWKSMLC